MTINNKPVCPCCGVSQRHAKTTEYDRAGRVVECSKCKAIYTAGTDSIYLGESYAIVRSAFSNDPTADVRSVYFDLRCLGSEGITRRHGWYDPTTKLLTQAG